MTPYCFCNIRYPPECGIQGPCFPVSTWLGHFKSLHFPHSSALILSTLLSIVYSVLQPHQTPCRSLLAPSFSCYCAFTHVPLPGAHFLTPLPLSIQLIAFGSSLGFRFLREAFFAPRSRLDDLPLGSHSTLSSPIVVFTPYYPYVPSKELDM